MLMWSIFCVVFDCVCLLTRRVSSARACRRRSSFRVLVLLLCVLCDDVVLCVCVWLLFMCCFLCVFFVCLFCVCVVLLLSFCVNLFWVFGLCLVWLNVGLRLLVWVMLSLCWGFCVDVCWLCVFDVVGVLWGGDVCVCVFCMVLVRRWIFGIWCIWNVYWIMYSKLEMCVEGLGVVCVLEGCVCDVMWLLSVWMVGVLCWWFLVRMCVCDVVKMWCVEGEFLNDLVM